MHKYNAKLVARSDSIEEKVTVDINGTIIVGFASICPYKIFVGDTYPVELGFTFLDVVEIDEISEERYGLERVGHACGYIVYGKVSDGSLDIGNNIKIDDEYFQECTYLEGSFMKVVADRISVEFLPIG